MKYLLVLFAFCTLSLKSAAQRDTLAINNNWQFLIDKNGEGFNKKWYQRALANSESVKLPHTWNVSKEHERHYGWGWYQHQLVVPAGWKNKNVVLQFGAINHTSIIYVNGKKVKENIGDGFNKIYVNLNQYLQYGAANTITVACNNDYGKNKVPYGSSFDWPNDGGIIRKASVIISGKPAASYIHAEPVLNADNKSGSLNIKLGFDEAAKQGIQLQVRITEENQASKSVILNTKVSPVWKNREATASFNLKNIKPWELDYANLYRIDVTLLDGRKAVDHISTNVGFRDFKFLNGDTYLNGQQIKLMGIEWTAGSNPDFGFAETDAEILRHARLMKDVNAVFSRVHFQQDDAFYDFCDRNGILLQEEVPLWGPETPSNDSIKSIAHRQLGKMISNHYNHPSIFAWGVGNELNGRDKNIKEMISGLVNKVRALDATRMASYVSNTLKDGFINNPRFVPDAGSYGDYVMMNEYAGSWWGIPESKLASYMDSIHVSYPDKPFIISEFGLCEPNFKGGDERRIKDLIYHKAIYESKPYVQGAIYFDLTDYRTHYPGTQEKNKYRRRIHGVYDMYGVPKPSMKVLRELSSPVEIQNMTSPKKGKLIIALGGHVGLPQYIAKGYKMYVSDKEDNYLTGKVYNLPQIAPGSKINVEAEDLFDGKAVITVVRPSGFIVSQKAL